MGCLLKDGKLACRVSSFRGWLGLRELSWLAKFHQTRKSGNHKTISIIKKGWLAQREFGLACQVPPD